MKKFLSVILAMILIVSLTACGDNISIEEDKTINLETENVYAEEKVNTEKEQENIVLEKTYNVPMQDIYVDVPSYQEIEQAYTELFIVHDLKYVAITAAFRSVADDAREAHKRAFEEFMPNMQNYEGGVNSIDIVKDETVNINGIEMYGFEGTINYGRDNIHDGYAIGYSFIMDGIPCEIIGSVIDEEQPQELIDEIKATVEAMIQTVRSEM